MSKKKAYEGYIRRILLSLVCLLRAWFVEVSRKEKGYLMRLD